MWKHRWLGLLIAWVVGVVGAGVLLKIPDRYEASARIYVDTQSILKPLMSGLAVQPNVEQQVIMLSRTLISRPNVEKLIRMADLDLGTDSSKTSKDELIDRMTKTLEVKTTGRDNLYTLSFRDSDPEKAKRVIQSLVSIFVESSLGDTRKDSDTAKRFLNDQIKAYEAKLEEAETRLKEFKLRNLEMQAGDGKDGVSRLAEMSAQLDRARLELREAENARDAAKRQLDAEKSDSTNVASRSLMAESSITIATPEIDARIEAQKRNLDGLLQRYTEQHPDVAGTRRLIKELEEQKKKEIAELRKTAMASPGSVGSNTSLAYQELNRMLAAAEVQVAALRARVAEYTSRYNRARELMKTAPQTEAEFTQLNRDYAIHKKNYDDLVARRESASLSGDLESAAGVADFRLIDPPRASNTPVAPNRLLLLPLVLVAALVAGAAVAFVASQLRPVFHDTRSLRNAVDLPLLGVVTMVLSDSALRAKRRDMRRFALASSGLIGFFVVGMVVLSLLSRQVG